MFSGKSFDKANEDRWERNSENDRLKKENADLLKFLKTVSSTVSQTKSVMNFHARNNIRINDIGKIHKSVRDEFSQKFTK